MAVIKILKEGSPLSDKTNGYILYNLLKRGDIPPTTTSKKETAQVGHYLGNDV
jgi:hypothetical protein